MGFRKEDKKMPLDPIIVATVLAFNVPDVWHRRLENVVMQQCVAEAVFAEARNGTDDDMALVANVTLFRGDPCDAIAAIENGVKQFPWYGKHVERRQAKQAESGIEQAAWDRSALMAVRVFTGEYPNPCPGAFYYNHVGGKNPTGSKRPPDCVTGKMQGWRE